jgi:hypothetical protein
MNVCVKSHTFTANLGLVRCKGSVTAKVTAEIVKVGIFLSTVGSLILRCFSSEVSRYRSP